MRDKNLLATRSAEPQFGTSVGFTWPTSVPNWGSALRVAAKFKKKNYWSLILMDAKTPICAKAAFLSMLHRMFLIE